MTRAQKILQQVDENIAYVGAALGAANIANAVYQARKRRIEKVQQGGMGTEHRQATQQLNALRKKQVMRLGLSGKIAGQVKKQKERVKDIENKGLERFNKGLTQNSQQADQVRKQELTA